ncbi:phosphate ABC transporter permease PstA [Ruminococcaceae bacterium OttesenSCG-928-I18]|nr:phosphate ABC transporter permease PstA [Ruminococcaceae bacterium OttesenSCG-928-I18]
MTKKNAERSFVQGVRQYLRNPLSLALWLLVRLAALITAGVFIALVGYILVKGVPYLSFDLFALEYNTENLSLFPALVNTVVMAAFSLLVAAPLGIFAALYLVEYAKRGNRVVDVIRFAAEALSGVPSIVYGLFGMLFFVVSLGWGMSILAGAFTLAIMILPLLLRTTEEALKAVPDMYREGSFGLGAGKLRTIFRIVLPAAVPGILSGVILAVGRVVSETAALIYTAGTVAQMPATPMDSGRTLALHMYALSNEGLYTDKAYATAVVLLLLVLGINTLSSIIAKRISKGTVGEDG